MEFRADQRLQGTVAEVEAALVDPGFYATLGDLTKVGAPELLSTDRKGDEIVQQVRYRFVADLPRAVTAVVDPAKLTWIEVARYDVAEHTSTHAIQPDHYADRLEGHYACTLADDGGVTIRVATGEIKVRVAFMGSRVERVIVDGLRDFAGEQADHLDRWMRNRHT